MTKLMAEGEFIEKRQTVEQQAQRLKIATEVSKLKARVKLLENTREVNGKVDRASAFTEYHAKRETPFVEKGIHQGDNPKGGSDADR